MAAFSVICLEAVPAAVRGSLSRWMIEPAEGTFVGSLPASVREEVWEMISRASDVGRASLIYPTNSEQGFSVRAHGDSRRNIRDFDEMLLVDFV